MQKLLYHANQQRINAKMKALKLFYNTQVQNRKTANEPMKGFYSNCTL